MAADNLKKTGTWYERFRPGNIDIMALPNAYHTAFKGYLESMGADMPSLLIHSHQPGTGKTTIAKIITKMMNSEYMFINLSLNRGIDVLREGILNFVTTKSLPGKNPIKLVHLDEADGATPELQRALRASIEEFSDTARFILTCNYPHMLIDPLRQRCTSYDFNFLRHDHREEMIPKAQWLYKQVLTGMNVEYDPAAVDALTVKMFPNMRDVYNHLQKAVMTIGKVDMSVLEGIAGYQDVFDAIMNCNWQQLWHTMVNHGIEPKSLYTPLYLSFIPTLPPALRPQAIEETEHYHHNSITSSDQQLTFAALSMKLMRLIGTARAQHPDWFQNKVSQ